MKISRAIFSVSDKTGIVEFAKFLTKKKVKIFSTGGTAKFLQQNQILVREISEITNFPEILDGRVKTLHPKIFGGILANRENENHLSQIKEQEIKTIDLVFVNLYPFLENPKIENIDIGGPSLLRAAAKNWQSVIPICEISDAKKIQQEIEKSDTISEETKKKLAGKVFAKIAEYDSAIAKFFDPNFTAVFGEKIYDLKYGENPHQKGSVFKIKNDKTFPCLPNSKKISGGEMGFCNFLDADAALNLISELPAEKFCAAAILKHSNPCGAAIGKNIFEAFQKALDADPISAFGGIVVLNQKLELDLAEKISETFFEIVLAPEISLEAIKILEKKKKLRLFEFGKKINKTGEKEIKSISGGFLQQEKNIFTSEKLEIISGKISDTQKKDLQFAEKICKFVKSNAITIVKNGKTIGIGAGQMSRVDATRIAIEKAGENCQGAVLASDAFFPFPDSVEIAAKKGIVAIVQPGGSIRDEQVFSAAKKLGVAMAITGQRNFWH